jgi:hypothetical protein
VVSLWILLWLVWLAAWAGLPRLVARRKVPPPVLPAAPSAAPRQARLRLVDFIDGASALDEIVASYGPTQDLYGYWRGRYEASGDLADLEQMVRFVS